MRRGKTETTITTQSSRRLSLFLTIVSPSTKLSYDKRETFYPEFLPLPFFPSPRTVFKSARKTARISPPPPQGRWPARSVLFLSLPPPKYPAAGRAVLCVVRESYPYTKHTKKRELEAILGR